MARVKSTERAPSISELEVLESKGLGEMKTSSGWSGSTEWYEKYALLLTDGDSITPGFNVRIDKNPGHHSDFLRVREQSEVYLFPQLVSEEEARKVYNWLE